jgi:repressor LexA
MQALYRSKRMTRPRELEVVTGFRSTHAVSALVAHLFDQTFPQIDAAGRLLPGGFFAGLAVLGTIPAGFPSPADEELTDTMSLDEYLITNREATYILKVTGDSRMNAGILPGDILLVERGAEARDGDIVIAQVDREWTLKYLRRRGPKVFLEAANKAYRPIYPQEELMIAAVVRVVIRKYA